MQVFTILLTILAFFTSGLFAEDEQAFSLDNYYFLTVPKGTGHEVAKDLEPHGFKADVIGSGDEKADTETVWIEMLESTPKSQAKLDKLKQDYGDKFVSFNDWNKEGLDDDAENWAHEDEHDHDEHHMDDQDESEDHEDL